MKLQTKNLFDEIPTELKEELFQTVAKSSSVTIERIVSGGHITPQGQWYDQEWDEWVLLISGSATLRFEKEENLHHLKPGDHIMIPAGCRHRVEQTDNSRKTIWLAVNFIGS
ncbi:MAG: cupin domain-containing protein [Desulfuromonadaceae bacterium]|nr:cupin domain-containing protein [Desulfuromonadaceae bacterium]MDD2855180.1 cupin domain-containing protein [Desulfuromonadaceae bacterium]